MDYVRGESIFTLMKNLNFKRTLKFMTNMSTISDCVSWSSHSNCVFQILREVDSKLEMFVSSPLILDTTLRDGGTFQFMQRSSTLKSSLALVRFASILFILYHDIHVNSNLVIDLYYIMIHTHTHTHKKFTLYLTMSMLFIWKPSLFLTHIKYYGPRYFQPTIIGVNGVVDDMCPVLG